MCYSFIATSLDFTLCARRDAVPARPCDVPSLRLSPTRSPFFSVLPRARPRSVISSEFAFPTRSHAVQPLRRRHSALVAHSSPRRESDRIDKAHRIYAPKKALRLLAVVDSRFDIVSERGQYRIARRRKGSAHQREIRQPSRCRRKSGSMTGDLFTACRRNRVIAVWSTFPDITPLIVAHTNTLIHTIASHRIVKVFLGAASGGKRSRIIYDRSLTIAAFLHIRERDH